MAKDPAFLFYPNDFTSGTRFMTDEQVGKYIRLLCAQFDCGHLSEKDMIMICKSYDIDIFSKFIKDSDGKFYNERLENEKFKRTKFCESRGKNREGKKKISFSYDNHMENVNENVNRNINDNESASKIEKLKKSKKAEQVEIILPYQTEKFRAAWELWKKYRAEQHRFVYKPLSEQSALIALKRISNDENEAITVIQQSIENSWKGLFPVSNKKMNQIIQSNGGKFTDQELAEAVARRHGINYQSTENGH